jgi:molybdopterin converting factor small subunit
VGGTEHITLTVLFFGATADAAGRRATQLEMPHGASSGEALEKLLRLYPGLASHKLLYSVNQSYAGGSEHLKSDDELAVFTAVSGG